jgi:hypothetical protein
MADATDWREWIRFLFTDLPSEALSSLSDKDFRMKVAENVDSRRPCRNGHTWTHDYGDDWTPEHGAPCDCGQKRWGIQQQVREHEWQFYANGSFCRRCGAAIGSGGPCR